MQMKLAKLAAASICAATLDASSADFEVTTVTNSGPGSLRQAIIDANSNSGPDWIVFKIPGEGVQTIRPATALPALTGPVVIDGYTQAGASPNTLADADNAVLRIHLDGAGLNGDGLRLTGGHSVIRGLVISRFAACI